MTDETSTFQDIPNNSEDSKAVLNRFQFLFDNPFVLQDLVHLEKQIPADHLEIDWVLHPDRPVAQQTVSLIRFQRSYLAARFHVRITRESRVLAMPSNLAFPDNSSNSMDLNDLSDLEAIPQVVDEFLPLSEDRFMLLLHHSESSWEMIGCLAPMPFNRVEVIDLSSHDEEAVSSSACKSAFVTRTQRPVWTYQNLKEILSMVHPTVIHFAGPAQVNDQSKSVTPDGHSLKLPVFDLALSTTKTTPFQCHICQREMSCKRSLVRHMIIHGPRIILECPDVKCSYMAYKKDLMNRHVGAHHPTLIDGINYIFPKLPHTSDRHAALIERKIYDCLTCSKKYRYLFSYENHIKTCSGVRSF